MQMCRLGRRGLRKPLDNADNEPQPLLPHTARRGPPHSTNSIFRSGAPRRKGQRRNLRQERRRQVPSRSEPKENQEGMEAGGYAAEDVERQGREIGSNENAS